MVSPGTRVIGSCVCDTPLSLSSALLSQVYLGSAQRRERNPLGRGDCAQEGGGVSFLSLWLHFSRVMDGPSKGSRRSRQRQSQWNADLLRNVAVLLYCTCLFVFGFFCPAVLCQSLVCLAAAQCTHVCILLLKPPCRGIFERTKWEIICLYEWKGAKCLHSLVVTARFIAPSGGKHGGRENKWLALEGSYFTHAKTYWASLIIRGGGDLSFLCFLANCPILVERKCFGYVSVYHEMPLPVIQLSCLTHKESGEDLEGDPRLGRHAHSQGSSSFY